MSALQVEDITVVVLAGGAGRRMGGEDKGLIEYQGNPLVGHVINAVSAQCGRIVINANRNHDRYASFGFPVVADNLEGFQGPLSGFLSTMQAVNSEYILTLPCDGPVVHPHYVSRMLNTIKQTPCDIVVASDGQRMQPVYALIPVQLQTDLHQFLEGGDRKIDLWYARHNTRLCEFPADSGFFTNINTPEELKTPH